MTEKPARVLVLEEGAKLTAGDRNADYGDPYVNLSASGELKAVFRRHICRFMCDAELEAIDMVLTKLGRIATGPVPKRDNYVDGSTYFAIAWEVADIFEEETRVLEQTLDQYFDPAGGPVYFDEAEEPTGP
jgi:hypothetical protein